MKSKFLMLLLLKFVWSMSQNGKDNFFPPTPEANSLIKYVDVPVNYSTGVTNYSIPVHTIKLKNLTIPITLTYQSSGLKPSEIAGNTGLGWELSAGGKITQNVVGQNDIDALGPANPAWNLPNDRDFKLPQPVMDLVFSSNPYTKSQLDSIHGGGTDYTMFSNINSMNIDTQPDLFYFSTPNKSGKFFFGNNFEAKQIPFGKEKITYKTVNGRFGSFEIIDTDGVKYIYNISSENLNFTENSCILVPRLNGSSNSNSYTFYLAQIITPSNETVDFIYDTVKYNLINDKDYTRYYNGLYGAAEKITTYSSENTTKVLTKIKVNQDYEVNFLYTNYRKDIKGKTQEAAPRTLDDVKINYKNEIETYHFEYGYFGIAEGSYNPGTFEGLETNVNSEYRLKLKSFQKNGENPYVFSYFNEAAVARYDSCLDHWGYYSASCGRYTMNSLFNDLGSNKEPNLVTTRTNVLKSVVLPTKGEVEFNYELNNCADYDIPYTTYNWDGKAAYANDDDQFTGEWISKEVIIEVPDHSITIPYISFSLDSPGPDTTSNYAIATLYDESGHNMDVRFIDNGSGNNFKPLDGVALIKGIKYRMVLQFYDTEENQGKFAGVYFLTASTNTNSNNNAVGGLRIQNIQTKDANNEITKRTFDYVDDGKSSGVLYEIPRYNDEYSFFVEMTNPDENVSKFGGQDFAVQYSRIPSDLFGFNGYHIFYKKVSETQVDTKDQSNRIKVEKYFTFYDDIRYGDQSYFSKISYNWKRGLISQINEFNKSDIIRKTIFSYKFLDTAPSDLNTSRYEAGFRLFNPSFPNEYHKRGIAVSILRASPSFYNLYTYSNSKIISAWYYMDKKTTEENFNGKLLKTEENYKYDNATHAQLTSQVTINSEGESIETKYYYPDDMLGQPFMSELSTANRISTPIITEQYKAGSLFSKSRTIYTKDATTGNLLLPKEIYAAKFPNDLQNLANIGKLEKKITYDQYDEKGNVLQYTVESGTPVSIIWGYNKTQPIAKIENVTYNSISAGIISNLQSRSNADDDNCMSESCAEQLLRNELNTLRNTFQNAFITTYTYNPLVGVTSVTDPKGVSSYYEYDAEGRLKFLKDQDLYILQKYCYNYKGQQTDCSNNTSTSDYLYKSAARSGLFTKNNCPAGGTGQSVTYNQAAGAYTSTISQADADSNGLIKFNTDGQAYADNVPSVKCIFKNTAKSAWFTRSNCAAGGTPENILYTVPAGKHSSESSQAEADTKAQNDINANGLAYANANARCRFWNTAQSGSFTRNNCAAGGVPETVVYTVPAGRYDSYDSQAVANDLARNEINANGLAYANANGKCTFYSAAISRSIVKNDCAAGGTGSSVPYSQVYGAERSYSSQAEADSRGLTKFNTEGQVYANANGYCTFYSAAISRSIAKDDCAVGGEGSSVPYSQVYGAERSFSSQAEADSKGLTKFNTEGQAYANANGKCTFYSIAYSGTFTNDECGLTGTGTSHFFTLAARAEKSEVSQGEANYKAAVRFLAEGQIYANTEGSCVFNSAPLGGYFLKNSCPAGTVSTSGPIYFEQSRGAVTSTISQANADELAAIKFNTDGPNHANAVGECFYYSAPISGSFTKTNCPPGGIGSTNVYSLAYGAGKSKVSQAEADAQALEQLNYYGKVQAEYGGTCTYLSQRVVYKIYKDDYCPPGTTFPYVYYIVEQGKYHSEISQVDADNKAWADVSANAQAYANANGICLRDGEVEE